MNWLKHSSDERACQRPLRAKRLSTMTVLGTGRAILVTSRILVTILVTVDFFVAILVTSRSQHTIAGTLRRNLTVKLSG